jgi:hypothetical protein
MKSTPARIGLCFVVLLMLTTTGATAEESWTQLKFDARRRGQLE